MDYKILEEMMKDATLQSDLYLPGNYWKFYEKNILKQIKNNDLTKFRSWPGGAGVGNIQSFGGGEGEGVINENNLGWVAKAGDYSHLNSTIKFIEKEKLNVALKQKIQQTAYKNFDFNTQLELLKREL